MVVAIILFFCNEKTIKTPSEHENMQDNQSPRARFLSLVGSIHCLDLGSIKQIE